MNIDEIWKWITNCDNPTIIGVIALVSWIVVQITKKTPLFNDPETNKPKSKWKWLLTVESGIIGTIMGLVLIGLDVESGFRGFLAGTVAVWATDFIQNLIKKE